jgi:S-ribosylhomocysteine lyase
MEKIASFTVNHEKLKRGIFVSRKDKVGESVLTTFDIRMTEPNREPVMNTGEIHAIEHLGATYLRNRADVQDSIIYFGPMGCRTGFYLIVAGDVSSREIAPLIRDTFEFIADYTGEVPGADPVSCGNYIDINLPMAKFLAKKYLNEVLLDPKDENFEYPM